MACLLSGISIKDKTKDQGFSRQDSRLLSRLVENIKWSMIAIFDLYPWGVYNQFI